jgi:predicted DCC family thiol-disulfide oxidoreductase YuxK
MTDHVTRHADDLSFIYDGQCGFCRASVTWLQQRFHLRGTVVASRRTDLAAIGLHAEEVEREAWFIASGKRYGGSAAIAAWLRTGSASARLLGRVMQLPGVRTVAKYVYRLVARNRKRIPGPWRGSCRL